MRRLALSFLIIAAGLYAQQGNQSVPSTTVTISGSGATATQVQGAAASGSPSSGNPVQIAGQNAGNAETLATDASGGMEFGSVVGALSDGNSNTPGTIGTATGSQAILKVYPWVFNGATWDRTGYCPNYVSLTQAASTTAQIIAVSGSTKIRICGFFVNSANTNTVTIEGGTGTNCGSTVTQSTGAMNVAANGTITVAGAGNYVLVTSASNELCLVTGAGVGGTTGGLMFGQW